MALNFTGGATAYTTMINNFSKTLICTPVTKAENNIEGDETLTDGTPSSITGAFFRKEDEWLNDKSGLIQDADAILLTLPSVTINKDDKISYDSENYRVEKTIERRLGTTTFYKAIQLFKI